MGEITKRLGVNKVESKISNKLEVVKLMWMIIAEGGADYCHDVIYVDQLSPSKDDILDNPNTGGHESQKVKLVTNESLGKDLGV